MQRMKVHLSGVPLPKLGSLQDRVMRDYLTHQDSLELAKTELVMMTAMTSPSNMKEDSRRSWAEAVNKVWDRIWKQTFFIKVTEEEKKASKLMDFYTNVVKKSKLKLGIGKDGTPVVAGLDSLLDNIPKK